MKRTSTVVVALVILLAGLSGAAIAEETIQITDDSDIDDGAELTVDIDGEYVLQYEVASEDSAVYIDHVDANGEVIEEDVVVDEDVSEADADNTYEVSVAANGADFIGIVPNDGESVHFEARIIDDPDADTPEERIVEFTYTTDEEFSVDSVTEDAADELVTFETRSSVFGLFENEVAQYEETREADLGTLTGFITYVEDEETVDEFATRIDETESGDEVDRMTAEVGGETVPVVYGDRPDYLDADDTYVVFWDDSEHIMFGAEEGEVFTVMNPDNKYDDTDEEVDVTVTANEGLGFIDAFSMYRQYDLSITDSISLALDHR